MRHLIIVVLSSWPNQEAKEMQKQRLKIQHLSLHAEKSPKLLKGKLNNCLFFAISKQQRRSV